MLKSTLILILLFSVTKLCFAQDSSKFDKGTLLPEKFFDLLNKRAVSIEQKLNKQTNNYLSKLQKKENKLRKKLWKRDSTLAKQLFEGVDYKYAQLKNTSGNVSKYQSVYSGHLDSLSTALNFLKDQNIENNASLENTLAQYKELQQKLNASDQVRKYLTEKQELLKEQFEKLGMVKDLKQFRKNIYYYQQYVRHYKEAIEAPTNLEEKVLESVLRFPQFKDFFAKNSLMGSLFALPGSNNTNSVASFTGLQTRQMINQSLIDRFGSSPAVTQQLQQNIQSGQGQLSQLKNKVSSYSTGSYGNTDDGDIPGFKPNDQKTKSFFQRLEYGTNVQSQRARSIFPVTSDIALSLGYRLNDKSVIGIGAAYKLGWGSNWNNIRITNQGLGLRSYLDWKIKGRFYVSGGYEQNYKTMISSIDQLRDHSAWQSSGLIGISKKYSISKKMKGEVKLLWDFLSYQQVPRSQPVLFRVGYSLK